MTKNAQDRQLRLFLALGEDNENSAMQEMTYGSIDYGFMLSSDLLTTLKEMRSNSNTSSKGHLIEEKVGWTFCHVAAAVGNDVLMKMLVMNGAPLDRFDENGHTPLHLAFHFGSMRCARIIEQAGADIIASIENSQLSMPISQLSRESVIRAAEAGRPKDVSLLVYLSARMDPNSQFTINRKKVSERANEWKSTPNQLTDNTNFLKAQMKQLRSSDSSHVCEHNYQDELFFAHLKGESHVARLLRTNQEEENAISPTLTAGSVVHSLSSFLEPFINQSSDKMTIRLTNTTEYGCLVAYMIAHSYVYDTKNMVLELGVNLEVSERPSFSNTNRERASLY